MEARSTEPVRTTEAKSVRLCVVEGCIQTRAIGMVCSGHAVNYHDDGRRRG